MLQLTEHEALLCLNTIPSIGIQKLEGLLKKYHTYANIWTSCYPQETITPKDIVSELNEKHINYITILDEEYPALLKEIASPPIVLYYQGDITLLKTRCLGIVGTRTATAYSQQVVNLIVPDLVLSGFTIVSGFQRGVDTLAHQKTIETQGKTIAVTGAGLAIEYPPSNKKLREQLIAGSGLIISEYPPQTPPFKANFPRRNRIISGLSKGVLIIEAALHSGSLITAKCAVEQNREVFAIPGSVLSTYSYGPHYLIQQGAKLVQNAQEIINELGFTLETAKREQVLPTHTITENQQHILNCLDVYGKHIDTLIQELDLTSAQVLSELTILEIEGVIVHQGNGIYSKTAS